MTDSNTTPWLKSYPAELSWDMPLPLKPAFSILDDAVSLYAHRPCLDFMGKKYSYKEVGQIVEKTATGLQHLGIQAGDKVGICLPNCPYYIIFFFAVLKTGATIVNFNPLYTEAELERQVRDSNCSVMITLDLNLTWPKNYQLLQEGIIKKLIRCPMADILPFPKNKLFSIFKRRDISALPQDPNVVLFNQLQNYGDKPNAVHIDPAKDLAVLQYTGGTTGVPKGAMLTHGNLYANCVQSTLWFTTLRAGQEKYLAVLPFFHVFAMTAIMNVGLRVGAEIKLMPRFDLLDTLKTMQSYKPSIFAGVPSIYNAINNHPQIDRYDLSSLHACISGGASLPFAVKTAFEKKTGCRLVEGYGLSESSPVACVNPFVGVNKPNSIGLPVPRTMIEILSLTEPDTVLPIGETGEICISGPQIMLGYWQKPEETAKTIRNGRLHTGDVGYIDEDGHIFIVDRIKDMINTNGYKVYPREVEEAIHQHPAVAECVVAGIPDAARGEAVKAWITLRTGQTLLATELATFLADKLAPIKMPRHYEFRQTLPKTMIGKLSRKDLVAEEKAKQNSSSN